MRLWHKDLITVLPRQQLLGQWRELCAIMANIAKKGTPNHVLVNKVMDYPIAHLYWYATDVYGEMKLRGYNPNPDAFCSKYSQVSNDEHWPSLIEIKDLFPGWMDDRYITQNYYNLQEKYDCGSITDEEWARIEERYSELTGEKNTCRNIYTESFHEMDQCANGFKCSKCGCTVQDFEHYALDMIGDWNCCPNCTAKVKH